MISEAVVAGVPVIASRVAGNVGLLSEDYPGYFEAGDTRGLARALREAEANDEFRSELRARCAGLARLFDPAMEGRRWRALIQELPADVTRARSGKLA